MCFADCEASDLGAVLGRLSNGIAGSSFVLNGVVYNISDSTDHWDKVLYAVHCILFKSSHVFAVCIIFTLSTHHHHHHHVACPKVDVAVPTSLLHACRWDGQYCRRHAHRNHIS